MLFPRGDCINSTVDSDAIFDFIYIYIYTYAGCERVQVATILLANADVRCSNAPPLSSVFISFPSRVGAPGTKPNKLCGHTDLDFSFCPTANAAHLTIPVAGPRY